MKPQYQHKVMTSFLLWFDNHLLTKGEAFSNKTGTFHYFDDSRLPDSYNTFSSPYKQFVNDSSISGATIKTGIPELQGFQTYTGLADNDAVDSFEVQMNPRLATPAEYSGITFHDHGETWRSYESGDSAPNEYWRFRVIDNGGPIWILNRISGASTLTHSTADITYPNPRSDYPWGMVWDDVNSNGLRNILSFDNPKDASNSDLDHETHSFATTILDYENGRIIETGSRLTDSSTITGTFAVKDFNVYLTNETEEDLILESKFVQNSRYGDSESGIKPYDQAVPAIFINSETVTNVPHAYGGQDETKMTIKAVVLAEDTFGLDGVLSIFADTRHKVITMIPFSGHPSTEYGDLKDGSYNYTGLSETYKNSETPMFIEDVVVSKLSDRAQKQSIGDLKVGFIDFDVSQFRYPRQ